jgi:hypothetical protein
MYKLKVEASSKLKQFELRKKGRDLSYLFTYVCADKYLKEDEYMGYV